MEMTTIEQLGRPSRTAYLQSAPYLAMNCDIQYSKAGRYLDIKVLTNLSGTGMVQQQLEQKRRRPPASASASQKRQEFPQNRQRVANRLQMLVEGSLSAPQRFHVLDVL